MKIHSFAFKNGIPDGVPDAAVVDCRGLTNPHNVVELRDKTGLDSAVMKYLVKAEPIKLRDLIALGKSTLKEHGVVAFGCYGGRHRSVVCAIMLANEVDWSTGSRPEVSHREL